MATIDMHDVDALLAPPLELPAAGRANWRRDARLVLVGAVVGLVGAAAAATVGGQLALAPSAARQAILQLHAVHEEKAVQLTRMAAEAAPRLSTNIVSPPAVEPSKRRRSEVLPPPRGDTGNSQSDPTTEFLPDRALSLDSFDWCNFAGEPGKLSYCTPIRNQHIPQYCGCCWAQGALSALSDRIKIARGARGTDIQLSVQHLLNCNDGIGTCDGGYLHGAYKWLKSTGGITYESSMPYMSCSSDKSNGLCSQAKWDCNAMNVARTCDTFPNEGGSCWGMDVKKVPTASIKEYGIIQGAEAMMKEIYERGPIACGIDAMYILDYAGGIVDVPGDYVDHIISVVGWGHYHDDKSGQDKKYWWVRNSWGEYWGEMGFVRVAFGALHVEDQCAYAVLDKFTDMSNQAIHCGVKGGECAQKADCGIYCRQPPLRSQVKLNTTEA